MKTTAVPAQVTTVEDRIVSNLGVSQVVLLSLPVLMAGVVFAGFPPAMHITVYKLVVLILFTALCGGLAIRIKGKIVLLWLVVLLRYNLRPGYYVYNKNSLANREQYASTKATEAVEDTPEKITTRRRQSKLTVAETIRVFNAIDNPAANFAFTTGKKGKLYVRITEVNQEG